MADEFSAVMDEVEAIDETSAAETADTETELPAIQGKEEKSETEAEGDNRTLPKYIRNLKESDPEGYRVARADFFTRLAFSQQFSGGIDEAKSVKAFVAEHGGLEGAQQAFTDLQSKAQEFEALNDRIANGDASLLDELPPESISALAPSVLTQWAKNDPDAYNSQLAGIFSRTINSSDMPMNLRESDMNMKLLANALNKANIAENPMYPIIKDAFEALFEGQGKIKGFLSGFGDKANAAPQSTKQNSALEAREQTIAQTESRQRAEQFDRQVESFKAPAIDKELKSFFDKDQDPERQDAARQMVRARVNEALAQEAKEKGKNSTAEQVKSLVQRGKLADAERIVRSRETLLIQQIAPKVGRLIYGNPAPAKVEVAAKAKPVVRTPSAGNYRSAESRWDEAFS